MPKKRIKKWHINCITLPVIIALVFSTSINDSYSGIKQDSVLVEKLTDVLREQFRTMQLDSAWATVSRIRAIAQDSDMQLKLADCKANYALIERVRGNNDSSISYYLQAARLYGQLGELSSEARAYTAIGQIYLAMQQYLPAYENFSQSLKLREKDKDSLGVANNLVNLGGTAYFAGRLDDAAAYYYRALRITDELNNLQLKAQIIMNVGNIHMRGKNYEKAIEYKEEALLIRRQQGDRQGESDVLMNLGISWYEFGFLEKAEDYYRESLVIKNELETDIPGIIKINNNLGLIAKERDDYPGAISYYNEALEMCKAIGDVQTQANILNNLGVIYLIENNAEAQSLFRNSLELATNLGLKKLEALNYDNIQQFYANQGSYQTAYEYLSKYHSLNDSLFNTESAERIARLQTQYDTEIKEKENQLLTEQTQVLRLRFVMMSVSSVAASIIAVSFIFLFNLKRKSLRQNKELLSKQNKLNQTEKEKSHQERQHLREVLFAEEEINRLQQFQIQEKNRELATSAIHIINKNETLNNLREKAKNAIENDPCQGKACVEQFIKEIDTNINLDEQWLMFKRHFESVHPGYFARLGKDFPNLTHNELKLSAYLRMNLSSKEIAQMLNISVDSAITKRYRLRKKLKLQGDDNLVDFLMQF